MVKDAFGTHSGAQNEPNDEAKHFYEQLKEASHPLYEGSVHSKLSVVNGNGRRKKGKKGPDNLPAGGPKKGRTYGTRDFQFLSSPSLFPSSSSTLETMEEMEAMKKIDVNGYTNYSRGRPIGIKECASPRPSGTTSYSSYPSAQTREKGSQGTYRGYQHGKQNRTSTKVKIHFKDLIKAILYAPKAYEGPSPQGKEEYSQELQDDEIILRGLPSNVDSINDVAHLEGYIQYNNPLWYDNIPPKDGNLFFEDESSLMPKESEVLERNDQLSDDNFDLLKCLRNPISHCSYENNYGCDPLYYTTPLFDNYKDELLDSCDDLSDDSFDVRGGSCLLEDSPLERKGITCLKTVHSSLCATIDENIHGDDLEFDNEYMHENTFAKVKFCDTFLYPLFAYEIINGHVKGKLNGENVTFGESEYCYDPCSWLILPCDPGDLMRCSKFHTPNLMLGLDEKQSLNEDVRTLHYDGKSLLGICNPIDRPKLCMRGLDSRSNPFQKREDDTSQITSGPLDGIRMMLENCSMEILVNVVGGIVVEVGKFVSTCIYPKIENTVCFSSKIENLREEMAKLTKFRDDIKGKVERAEEEGYKPKPNVIKWIEDVCELEKEWKSMQESIAAAKKIVYKCCPKCSLRSEVSTQARVIRDQLCRLIEVGKNFGFNLVIENYQMKKVEFIPGSSIEGQSTTIRNLSKLLRLLEDDEVMLDFIQDSILYMLRIDSC
ncbi:hypothetical protein FXO38_24208 [Capsicum annuum]|nr:hypothetical protein FXO38_24208 [Capsicum annuum]